MAVSYPIRVRCIMSMPEDSEHPTIKEGDICIIYLTQVDGKAIVRVPDDPRSPWTLSMREASHWGWLVKRFEPVEVPAEEDKGKKEGINVHDALSGGG